jgi:hypothetical protein
MQAQQRVSDLPREHPVARAARLSEALRVAKEGLSPDVRVWIAFADGGAGDAHGSLSEDHFDSAWLKVGEAVARSRGMTCVYAGPKSEGSDVEHHYLVFA